MRTLTFSMGGIHPPDRKKATRGVPARNAIIPRTSIIPLIQHTGASAVARVGVGDRVREGMLIGRASGSHSGNVHASTPGVVREVRPITLPDGRTSQAVVIDMDGEFDRLGKAVAPHEWSSLSSGAITRLIEENGVVCMGGAPVPTHAAIQRARKAGCTTLILNGSESEPYLTADHRLMVERADAVLAGLRIVARAVGAEELIVAVERNKPDAITALERASHDHGLRPRMVRLRVKYPQGDERQLIQAVTGREVPSGGAPDDVRVMCIDAATAKAVCDAVVLRQPLVERIVTVGGGGIAAPANLKVRIGTPIADLIEECGGFSSPPAKLVAGGPLVGHTITDLMTPITKAMRGVLALTEREVRAAPRTPCINCGRCVTACPMGLNPARLFKFIEHDAAARAVDEGLFDCTECGSCGYICPSRIPLVQGMRAGKTHVREGLDG